MQRWRCSIAYLNANANGHDGNAYNANVYNRNAHNGSTYNGVPNNRYVGNRANDDTGRAFDASHDRASDGDR